MNARFAALAIACMAGHALAQGTGAAGAPAGGTPGAQIAGQGNGPQVPACAGCHGAQGEGVAASGFPRLAGQSARYLARQLDGYASGARTHAVMTPIAKALTQEQRVAVAAHYASLRAPAAAGAQAKPTAARNADAARGQRLASVGDATLRVQACANCHGPEGRGEPPDYPYLAGQFAGYLASALAEFRAGQRTTDPTGQMPAIARQLRDADVAALAAYFAARGAPPPAPAWTTVRPGAPTFAAAPARVPATGNGGGNKPGVDTEQGSPTTGGGQGNAGGANQGTNPAGSGNAAPSPPAGRAAPPR